MSPTGLVSLVDGPKSFPLGPGCSVPQRSGLPCFEFTAAPGDTVRFTISRSMLSWPTPFETNFMTGVVPSWKRYLYCRLIWVKPSRARLDILWRFEQAWFREGGWRPPKIEYGVSGFVHASFPKIS